MWSALVVPVRGIMPTSMANRKTIWLIGPTVALGDPGQFRAGHRLAVGGKQGKSLVDKVVGGAELSDATIPASDGVTSVLDEAGSDACLPAQALELFEGDVADSEQADPAAVVDRFHRSPGCPVGGSQTGPLRGAVQQVGIDHLSAQMLERAGERLLDLDRDGGLGIVGQAMILPPPEGELGLQEQIIPDQRAALDQSRDGLPDRRFVVMAALVGRIDASKSLSQSELGQALRLVLFPSGPVQEARALEHRQSTRSGRASTASVRDSQRPSLQALAREDVRIRLAELEQTIWNRIRTLDAHLTGFFAVSLP